MHSITSHLPPSPPSHTHSQPRALMHDPDSQDTNKFHLEFLYMLKKDVKKIYEFTQQCLSKDQGTPRKKNMSADEIHYYENHKNCDLCGRAFGSVYQCKRTGKLIKVIKNPGKLF